MLTAGKVDAASAPATVRAGRVRWRGGGEDRGHRNDRILSQSIPTGRVEAYRRRDPGAFSGCDNDVMELLFVSLASLLAGFVDSIVGAAA